MSFSLVVRPEAERDMAETRDWYDKQRDGLGSEFLAAVEAFFGVLGESPEMYAADHQGVRPARLKRFPYVVYYRIKDDCVEVLGVLHGSRHPRVWQSRA